MGFSQKFELKNKNILITGASKGIGEGVSKIFTELGANVYLVARSTDALKKVAEEISKKGGKAHVFSCDLRDVSAIKKCVEEIAAICPKIDVLFNNAGMGNPIPALNIQESDWDEMMSLNLKAMFFFSQAVAAKMSKTGGGRIVNMSSQASVVAIDGETIYCASKAAVNQMTKNLAFEWAKYGITVNAIGPTFIRTPGTAERLDNPEFYANVIKNIPLGRVGTIEEVAAAAAYFASDASSFSTGSFLLLDGGWTIC